MGGKRCSIPPSQCLLSSSFRHQIPTLGFPLLCVPRSFGDLHFQSGTTPPFYGSIYHPIICHPLKRRQSHHQEKPRPQRMSA